MVIGTFQSFDETRSSLLSSSSVVKVHHSFGRAHENTSCVCRNEGFRLNDSSRWPRAGWIRRWDCPCYVVRDGPVKGRRLWTRPDPGSGAEETRTPDVLLAKEVLYQLSYGPKSGYAALGIMGVQPTRVGVSGLEPEASALSGQCSNQLS
jgi:hypothetical protein